MQSGATSLLIRMVIKKDGAVEGRSAGIGSKPIEAVKKVVNANLNDWKKDTSQSSSKRTLTHLVSDFKRTLLLLFRKASEKKIKAIF